MVYHSIFIRLFYLMLHFNFSVCLYMQDCTAKLSEDLPKKHPFDVMNVDRFAVRSRIFQLGKFRPPSWTGTTHFPDPCGMCQCCVCKVNFKIRDSIHTGHIFYHSPSVVRWFCGAAEAPMFNSDRCLFPPSHMQLPMSLSANKRVGI